MTYQNIKKYSIAHKKIIFFMSLACSLSVNCAFGILQKAGKLGSLTCLTPIIVAQVQQTGPDKRSVAAHEVAHAVIDEKYKPGSVISLQVKPVGFQEYSGEASKYHDVEVYESFDDKRSSKDLAKDWQLIVSACAGYAQDAQNQEWKRAKNFMELELGLPLSYVRQDALSDLEYMYHHGCYQGDVGLAMLHAECIARDELNLHRLSDDFDASMQKQIDTRIDELVRKGIHEAKKLVQVHKNKIDTAADILAKKGYISGNEFREIIKK